MGNHVINQRQEVLITTTERHFDKRLCPNWVERCSSRTIWLVEEEDDDLDFGSPERVFTNRPPPPIGAPNSKWIPGPFYQRRMVRMIFLDIEVVKKYLEASPRPKLLTLRHLVSLPQSAVERCVEEVRNDEVQARKGLREFWLASKWIPGRFYRLNYAELLEGLISPFKKTTIVMVHDADKGGMVRVRFRDAEAVNKFLDASPRSELPTLSHLVCLPQSVAERFVEEVGNDEVQAKKGSRKLWLGVLID
ncbi:hypothetical protein RHSIM_Rhsim12G0146200 [Rhododendron simsii]|uniref:Uncharacterized protein n=1 Tax=Rhododendron simsii TaxID=118357 RepID=A0A834G511_RHOSS|nr:hypothetical protein RHSIM_Rhsim12G0146200 [Rhododendron simsii]